MSVHVIESVASGRILYGFAIYGIELIKVLSALMFDGVDIGVFGVRILSVSGRMMPPVKSTTISIPGSDGTYYVRSHIEQRVLDVKLCIKAKTKAEYLSSTSNLMTLLDPTKGEKSIIFNDDPSKTYYGRFEGQSETYRQYAYSENVFTFVCSDPLAYGVRQLYSVTPDSVIVVDNSGSRSTPFIATITGPAAFPHIEVNSKWFRYEGTLMTGDELIIDTNTKAMTAKLNGANVVDKISGELFELDPGSRVVAISSGQMTLDFTPRWL